MPLTAVVRASMGWLMILLGSLIVVNHIPEISTFLPNLLFGKTIQ